MITILSPAKRIDTSNQDIVSLHSMPDDLEKSELLVKQVRKLKPAELAKLMSISSDLAYLTYERFQEWQSVYSTHNAKQAILSFSGDAYQGMDASTFSRADFEFAQDHLRILSGLHGILKPLDLILPYRLEMGTKLSFRNWNNLYQFWGDSITVKLNQLLKDSGSDTLINLASNEYFKAVNKNKLNARIIVPEFKEFKDGTYKFMSFYGKKARGMMARYIIQNRINDAGKIKHFDRDGYFYNDLLSDDQRWVFTRG